MNTTHTSTVAIAGLLLTLGVVAGCGDSEEESSGPASDAAYCTDDSAGSGTLSTPVGSGTYAFSTVLLDCSLSDAEVAECSGAVHSASETISGDMRTISGNSIPNHGADLFPNLGNPNAISAQNISYSVTTNPTLTTTATPVNVAGIGINGIKMEPETAEVYSDTAWRYEALTFNGRLDGDTSMFPDAGSLGFDCNFAHVQPTGEYHYHGVPTGLMPSSPEITLVGWAADGFPILGRYGYTTPGDASSSVKEMTGSYALKSGARQPLGAETAPTGDYDGTFVQDWEFDATVGDLDACNGRQESIEIEDTTYAYAYYLTYTYPFMPRCVWGTPGDSFVRGGGGGGMEDMMMGTEGDLTCAEGQTAMCCGDGVCDGPETADNCASDC